MKRAIYPGSFNPWHSGHTDILAKALKIFDQVLVARGINPDKSKQPEMFRTEDLDRDIRDTACRISDPGRVQAIHFTDLLPKIVKTWDCVAVIRGLWNGNDLQYEMNQQYWYEDLGLTVPVVYLITDRTLSHISSSAIRALESFRKGK